MYQVVVPKPLAPKDLVAVFESGEKIVLPAWDPMVRHSVTQPLDLALNPNLFYFISGRIGLNLFSLCELRLMTMIVICTDQNEDFSLVLSLCAVYMHLAMNSFFSCDRFCAEFCLRSTISKNTTPGCDAA